MVPWKTTKQRSGRAMSNTAPLTSAYHGGAHVMLAVLPRPRCSWRHRGRVIVAQAQREVVPLLLEPVRVVLVSPKTPANIGSVLRAAENFETHDVFVVDPRCDPRCDEVRKVSVGSPVYENMQVVPTLMDALSDTTGSVGFTRRSGAKRVPHPSITHLLSHFPGILPPPSSGSSSSSASQTDRNGRASSSGSSLTGEAGAAAGGPSRQSNGSGSTGTSGSSSERLALVFGREESGLLEEELVLCSHACSIPTGRSQPSINLSHAVAVVLAQLYERRAQELAGGEGAVPDPFESSRARFMRERTMGAVSQREIEVVLGRWAAMMAAAGINTEDSVGTGNHSRRRLVMGHMRAMLQRSRANSGEIRALHYLCQELEAALEARGCQCTSSSSSSNNSSSSEQHQRRR